MRFISIFLKIFIYFVYTTYFYLSTQCDIFNLFYSVHSYISVLHPGFFSGSDTNILVPSKYEPKKAGHTLLVDK